jgi:hypothetical protein
MKKVPCPLNAKEATLDIILRNGYYTRAPSYVFEYDSGSVRISFGPSTTSPLLLSYPMIEKNIFTNPFL